MIAPNFVLTAAHVVSPDKQPGFYLAQPCLDCLPYGFKSVKAMWIPEEWSGKIAPLRRPCRRGGCSQLRLDGLRKRLEGHWLNIARCIRVEASGIDALKR